MGPSAFKLALEYIDWEEQNQDSEGEKTTDVFTAGTPGALSLKDLEREVDLGQWKLKLGQRLVNLEVKSTSYLSTWSLRMLLIGEQRLAGWEESEISDSSSIKGIAAELAACIGPELVNTTALFFG